MTEDYKEYDDLENFDTIQEESAATLTLENVIVVMIISIGLIGNTIACVLFTRSSEFK